MPKNHFEISFTRGCRAHIEAPDGVGNPPLVLGLHGLSMSGHEMRHWLAPAIAKGTHAWLLPDGPFPFERRNGQGIGHAWYLFAGDQKRLRATMDEAIAHLTKVLDEAARQVVFDPARVSVLGFSQGGYLAGVLAAAMQERFRGACCAAGRFKHEFFAPPVAGKAPKFLQLHGARDELVLPSLAEKAAQATRELGYDVTMKVFEDAGHELTPAMQDAFLEWEGTL